MCAINTVILPLLVPFPYCTLHSLAWLDGGVSREFLLCSTFETVPFPVSADCSFRCAIGSGGRYTTVHGKFYFVHAYMYCIETMPNLLTHCTLLDMWCIACLRSLSGLNLRSYVVALVVQTSHFPARRDMWPAVSCGKRCCFHESLVMPQALHPIALVLPLVLPSLPGI